MYVYKSIGAIGGLHTMNFYLNITAFNRRTRQARILCIACCPLELSKQINQNSGPTYYKTLSIRLREIQELSH